MKNRNILSLSSLAVMLTVVFAMACNKKFDEPALDIDPGVTANTTIAQLRAMAPANGQMVQLSGGKIIKGIVTGNDRTGNIYKQLFIQDETAGMLIEVNHTGLYNIFPEGREIFIVTDGLWLINETGMVKLALRAMSNNTPVITGIPSNLLDKYIKRGSLNNVVQPKVITSISQLDNSHQSMLIQLNNYEFGVTDYNKTWADTSANKATENRTLNSCPAGENIIIRTSGYASFAGAQLPKGKGSVKALYTVFVNNSGNTTRQLIIRDTTDLKLDGLRCDGTAGGPPVYKSLAEIRQMYTGTSVTLGNYLVRGVVISDASNGNVANGNIFIQDGERGIDLFFGPAANTAQFNVGDSIEVNVAGGNLIKFNGLLEISLPGSALPSTKLATGRVITPKVLTIAQVIAGIDDYESTLVRINSASASAASTYAGSKIINDATGSLTLWTLNQASFSSSALTTDCKNWVGIPTRFNTTNQLQIRSLNDVTAGTGCVGALGTVTTNGISSVTATTAQSGGNVTSDGGTAVTARGVVWSTSTNPTVALATKTVNGTGVGTFTSSITGLTSGTQYYVRAYVTNSAGTAYGNEVTFTAGSTTTSITEDFENGTKTSYTTATENLASGAWTFSDAIIGTAANDMFVGAKSARIRGTVGSNNGYIQTDFDLAGLQSVTISHAQTNFTEPAGAVAAFDVYMSTNGGTNWTKVGSTITSTKGVLNTVTVPINASAGQNVRIRILNMSDANGSNQVRINIDNVKFNF